jgi:arylsulfatase A-like enzyme
LEHSTNAPRRGGKHTFWDGGVRVEAFLAGGAVPPGRSGTTWPGLAHASDTYLTLVEGYAGVAVGPADTCNVPGCRPLDGLNLWAAIMGGGPSPRSEVVHQVNNSYFDEGVSAIRVGDLKVIRGQAGDNRTIPWPERAEKAVPLGLSGAVVEAGTDHVRGTTLGGSKLHMCKPFCLFNITADEGETLDLAHNPAYAQVAASMLQRLDQHGATGPPHAYIWDTKDFPAAVQAGCPRQVLTGSVQPVDI